jgi:hypothetical protein
VIAADAEPDGLGVAVLRLARPVRIDREGPPERDRVGLACGNHCLSLFGRDDPRCGNDRGTRDHGLQSGVQVEERHLRIVTVGKMGVDRIEIAL